MQQTLNIRSFTRIPIDEVSQRKGDGGWPRVTMLSFSYLLITVYDFAFQITFPKLGGNHEEEMVHARQASVRGMFPCHRQRATTARIMFSHRKVQGGDYG